VGIYDDVNPDATDATDERALAPRRDRAMDWRGEIVLA
jgi:hypothetical protein